MRHTRPRARHRAGDASGGRVRDTPGGARVGAPFMRLLPAGARVGALLTRPLPGGARVGALLMRLLPAGLLGAGAAVLVACGSSGTGLIPAGNAQPLVKDFQAVEAAAAKGNGNCAPTQAALHTTERDFQSLPPSVNAGLRGRLHEGIVHLQTLALELCAQPQSTTTGTTGTATTPPPAKTKTTPPTSTGETTGTTGATTPGSTTPSSTTPGGGEDGTAPESEGGGAPGEGEGNSESGGAAAGGGHEDNGLGNGGESGNGGAGVPGGSEK